MKKLEQLRDEWIVAQSLGEGSEREAWAKIAYEKGWGEACKVELDHYLPCPVCACRIDTFLEILKGEDNAT